MFTTDVVSNLSKACPETTKKHPSWDKGGALPNKEIDCRSHHGRLLETLNLQMKKQARQNLPFQDVKGVATVTGFSAFKVKVANFRPHLKVSL